jgi:protoheme IX farnesyltransferase
MSLASHSLTPETTSTHRVSSGSAGDFFALLKPRVMSLVVFTALTGMMLAPQVNPVLGFAWLLAIAVGAGASGCLNMWYDADIDAMMGRTAQRPIPSGKVTQQEALGFGIVLSVGSVAFLGLTANWLAGGLLAFTIFFYAVVYSMWLKRWTAQNIVIGGAAGAFPPMIGYAAATGSLSIETAVLFGIIFLWTPPHFWALAILKTADYRRAGVPMLPVVAGEEKTRVQILLYSLAGALRAAAGRDGLRGPALRRHRDRDGRAHGAAQLAALPRARRRGRAQGGGEGVHLLHPVSLRAVRRSAGGVHRRSGARRAGRPRLACARRRSGMSDGERGGIVLTEEEKKRRRSRSVALGVVLGALVVLFFVVTVAKLGGNVLKRPL